MRLSEPCAWCVEVNALDMHFLAGVRRRGAQTHRRCIIRSYQKGTDGICAPRQTSSPGASLPSHRTYVVDTEAPKDWRIMSWWVLLQSLGTLRFDDHRGLLPAEMVVNETGLATKLSRPKVSGPDKEQKLRLVVVAAEAYVQHSSRPISVWKLLCEAAPYVRNYLLPAPTSNYKGCRQAELQYHTAFAMQTRLLALAAYRGQRLFRVHTGHYYTPHSGRIACPVRRRF